MFAEVQLSEYFSKKYLGGWYGRRGLKGRWRRIALDEVFHSKPRFEHIYWRAAFKQFANIFSWPVELI